MHPRTIIEQPHPTQEIMQKIYLRTGELYIATKPTIITTVLGSCISVCLWDKRLGIGGLNHFALPHTPTRSIPSNKYGELAMKNLLSGILKLGVKKNDLVAMIFGGGKVTSRSHPMLNIGEQNVDYAKAFLHENKIKILKSRTGLSQGRKIYFNTATGAVKVFKVNSLENSVLKR